METSRPWPWPRVTLRTTRHVLGLDLRGPNLGICFGYSEVPVVALALTSEVPILALALASGVLCLALALRVKSLALDVEPLVLILLALCALFLCQLGYCYEYRLI